MAKSLDGYVIHHVLEEILSRSKYSRIAMTYSPSQAVYKTLVEWIAKVSHCTRCLHDGKGRHCHCFIRFDSPNDA